MQFDPPLGEIRLIHVKFSWNFSLLVMVLKSVEEFLYIFVALNVMGTKTDYVQSTS